MASDWARSQREGWLCRLYGTGEDDDNRVLPPDSIQARILNVLEGLLLQNISPRDAAAQTASHILSEEDISTPWSNHVGMHLHAVQNFSDEETLRLLAAYLIELASLPDAITSGPGPKTIETALGRETIEPGQRIELDGGTLWSGLPEYSWNLSESFQGPEQYLHRLVEPYTPAQAAQAWSNVNTYLALKTIDPRVNDIPALARHITLGLRTLAMALEWSGETWLGKNAELHAPAAAQWLRIAGKEIDEVCKEGREQTGRGDMWEKRGGGLECDAARLGFWRERLAGMGFEV
ncbi:hypothetical protein C7974DRAFT_367648 [Boeremia exigua]|uniref:uncharacterized protein n=1 Tax=Boeremia exigua TaxID=749465 RepID=UPI001E8EAA50|nr:uncharacterized protein C7974DRAFT_367648 [Boeremia exigua]KAH6615373.1 hypothetical protein C7974DRAFT_367648 [Boeremia exigua]